MRQHLRFVLAALALTMVAACAGKGCGCLQPIKGGFPVDKRHENAIQVRATQALFSYISQNGATILPKLLPGGSTFNVPSSGCGGSQEICCGTPPPMCRINLDFKKVDLATAAPSTVHLSADLVVKTLDHLKVHAYGQTCFISIDTTRGSPPTLNIATDLAFAVDKTTNTTAVSGNNTAINVDSAAFNFHESGSDAVCYATIFPPFQDLVVGILKGLIADQLTATVNGLACMKCAAKADCNSFASDCKGGVCVEADGKTCVPSLGLEGRMDVASVLGKFLPGGAAAFMDLLAVAGGYARADTGLSLGFLGGGLADPHNGCVPMVPPPPSVAVPQSTTFDTDFLPDGATPYHVGFGIHHSHLDLLGWSAFDAGALCLRVGTAQAALLSTKTIGLVIPSLSDLVHVSDAPVYIQLKPSLPPTFTLGKGTFKDTGSGRVVDDPLLTIALPGFALDFYAFTDDRYVRILTLTADVTLPLNLDVDAQGKLNPVFGDLSHAFANTTVTNSQLLAESPSDLAKAFPMLLSVAVGQLAGALKGIALPAVLGLSVKPLALTSSDPDRSGARQFLSVFANIGLATAAPLSARTSARVVAVTTPPLAEFAVTRRGPRAPEAILAVDGEPSGRLEYAWSLDGGPWSPFAPGPELVVRDPQLWLAGRHTVDVRARVVGQAATTDDNPARVDVVVAPDSAAAAPTTTRTASGCSLAPEGAPSLTLVGLVALILLFARRRLVWLRRLAIVAGTAVVAALVLGAAGCGSHLGKGAFANPTDEIGRYSDLAVKDGVLYLSAYDDTYGDLVYARVTDPKAPIGWQVLDGVDMNASVLDKNGYRFGITDPGPDVGLYTSLALDGDHPLIAYFDATSGALKLARGPHPFDLSTVDSGSASAPVGMFASMSLDKNNVPSIAYLATGIAKGSGFSSELRVATAANDHPGAKDWTIRAVDSTAISCGGRCAGGSACIVPPMVNGMPNSDPTTSTCVPVDTTPCAPACASTEACIKHACTAFLPPAPKDLPEGIGLFAQARRDSKGALQIVYYDHAHGSVKLAAQSGGGFTITTLDGPSSAAPSADTGQFCTAAVAADDSLYVAYVDAHADALLGKHVSGGNVPASADVIDDGMRADGHHGIGASANLVLDGAGHPRVAYQDRTTSSLELAVNAGAWSHHELATGVPGFGFYPRQLVVGNTLYMTEFVYDRENGPGTPFGQLQISIGAP